MKKFEYLTAIYEDEKKCIKIQSMPAQYAEESSFYKRIWKDGTETLEILGRDGWELVASSPVNNFRCNYEVVLFFKREVTE